MSAATPKGRPSPSAPVFAALGDRTRLRLLTSLAGGEALSIARLTKGSTLSRQAITKHLGVLEQAGLVRSIRRGRENLFELEARRLDGARRSLEAISRRWDEALARLKAFAEGRAPTHPASAGTPGRASSAGRRTRPPPAP